MKPRWFHAWLDRRQILPVLQPNAVQDSRKQMKQSTSATREQTPSIIYVRYADGSKRLATATTKAAAWMCTCGLMAPLAGSAPASFHDNVWTVCPNCDKRFRVVVAQEGNALVVLEAGVTAPTYGKIALFKASSLLKLDDSNVVDK